MQGAATKGIRLKPGGGLETASFFGLLSGVFPGFGVFPAYVYGVVEVEEQAFASVEEAESEEVVVDEGGDGIEDDVPDEGEG